MTEVELSELVRNYGIVIGGGIGLWLAWQRSHASIVQAEAASDQAKLARRDHVVELFNRAVEQLGHDRLEVRLGAIYTLREIDRDFPQLSKPVFELLSVYLRERTGRQAETNCRSMRKKSFASSGASCSLRGEINGHVT